MLHVRHGKITQAVGRGVRAGKDVAKATAPLGGKGREDGTIQPKAALEQHLFPSTGIFPRICEAGWCSCTGCGDRLNTTEQGRRGLCVFLLRFVDGYLTPVYLSSGGNRMQCSAKKKKREKKMREKEKKRRSRGSRIKRVATGESAGSVRSPPPPPPPGRMIQGSAAVPCASQRNTRIPV